MLIKKTLLTFCIFIMAAVPLLAKEGASQFNGSVYLGVSGASATAWNGSMVGFMADNDPTLWGDASQEIGGAGGAGIAYRYFVNENMAIATGLSFIYKSFSVVYPAITAIDDLTIDYGTTYLIIPFGVRVYLDYFYFGGGVYYGLAGDTEAELTVTTFYGKETEKQTLNFNDDFGLYVDLGLDIPLSPELGLELGMRYERGLKEVYTEEDIVTNIKTNAFLFNVGLSIMI